MQETIKRKLIAILSADVAGYSRLMDDDEVSTVRTLQAYQKIISDLTSQHNGRVVDSPGDNLMAEFGSVVDAVQCAMEIQQVLQAKNDELPEDRRMQFRIGIMWFNINGHHAKSNYTESEVFNERETKASKLH